MEKIKIKWAELKTKFPTIKYPTIPKITLPSKPQWLPSITKMPSMPKMPEITVPERI
jgi:hypothetical protein